MLNTHKRKHKRLSSVLVVVHFEAGEVHVCKRQHVCFLSH